MGAVAPKTIKPVQHWSRYMHIMYRRAGSCAAYYALYCLASPQRWLLLSKGSMLDRCQFKPIIFPALGFSLSNIASNAIPLIFTTSVWTLIQFCDSITHETEVDQQPVNRESTGDLEKKQVVRRTSFCSRCDFERDLSASNPQAGANKSHYKPNEYSVESLKADHVTVLFRLLPH